jgi:plasmid maintenance system antidote protein VapI
MRAITPIDKMLMEMVRKEMTKTDLSVTAVAARVNLPREMVSRIVNGSQPASIPMWQKIWNAVRALNQGAAK